MGEAYTATAHAIPAGPQYVALGHIHAPQRGARLAGSGRVRRLATRARLRGSRRAQACGDRRRRAGTSRAVVTSVPLRWATARARRGDVGGPGSSRRGAGGQLPRPHGPGRRAGRGPGSSSRRDVPLPRQRPAGAAARRTARPRRRRAAAHGRRAVRRVLPGRGGSRSPAELLSDSSGASWKRWPMRPRELTLQGFRSYRDRSTFDFRDRRLIGVVGPIGSGKSSLLDAIVVRALRQDTDVRARHAIVDPPALRRRSRRVRLRGRRTDLARPAWAPRTKGQSGHQLERLSKDAPRRGRPRVRPVGRPVRERVEQLLGMGFDAFRRSVLLAQNRFAEFLRASDGQRNDVLKGVFGYERFDAALTAAKDRARDAEASSPSSSSRAAACDKPRRSGERRRRRRRRRRPDTPNLDAARRGSRRTTRPATAAQGAGAEAGQRIGALRGLAATLPPADELAAVIRVAEEGGGRAGAAAGPRGRRGGSGRGGRSRARGDRGTRG